MATVVDVEQAKDASKEQAGKCTRGVEEDPSRLRRRQRVHVHPVQAAARLRVRAVRVRRVAVPSPGRERHLVRRRPAHGQAGARRRRRTTHMRPTGPARDRHVSS